MGSALPSTASNIERLKRLASRSFARVFVVAFLAASSACLVDVSFTTGLLCSDNRCPEGQSCVSGRCVLGAVPDAGSDAPTLEPDASTPRVCGGSVALREDFSDANAEWWLEPPALDERRSYEGAMTLTILAETPPQLTQSFSRPRFDLRNSRWAAEVTTPISTGDEDAIVTFGIQGDLPGDAQRIAIRQRDGDIVFGQQDNLETMPYDEDAHRYWAFRHLGDTVYLETSPDGVNFEIAHRIPAPQFVRRFQSMFRIENPLSSGAAEARFDNINTNAPVHSFCPISDISDDFEDGVVGPEWSVFGSCPSGVSEVDGALTIPAASQEFCVFTSNGLYDVSSDSLTVEFDELNEMSAFEVKGENGSFKVQVVAGIIRLLDCPLETCANGGEAPYLGQQFFRFRGDDDGSVIVEVSNDGADWTAVGLPSTSLDPTMLRFSFTASEDEPLRILQVN